ncbi:hypothetical protein [Umezawaea sp.]|uniref:hypothetical protein n=1 Tax=Umezawaea sp. TaxID=1955258 RepID=UPI002ED3E6B5
MTARRAYLDAAEEAGLLHRAGGLVVIADPVEDPVTGRRRCLVEHVGGDGPDPAVLLGVLRDRWPDCQEALVRTEAPAGPLGSPFVPYLTYVVREPPPPGAPPAQTGPVLVRAGTPGDRAAITSMLAEAFDRAVGQHGHRADPAALAAAAESVVDDPARVTYVAERDSRVVGHVTLLTDTTDDPTGARYVELLDVLVRPLTDREASRRLVAAAEAHAARTGTPLMGHVVHVADDPAHAERTLAVLGRAGWRIAHHYSWADFGRGGG